MVVLLSLLLISLLGVLPTQVAPLNNQPVFWSQVNERDADAPTQPIITLVVEPLPPIPTGQTTNLSAQLVTATDEAVTNLVVVLSHNGEPLQRRRTDALGRVTFILPKEWPPGDYPLTLRVLDTPTDEAVSATLTVVVEPIQVRIQVIPPLAGIRFALAGRATESDATGQATFTLVEAGRYELELLTATVADRTYRYQFDRWHDEIFEHRRTLLLPKDAFIQTGFEVSYQATPSFVDTEGVRIDPTRITTMTVQSSHGALLTLAPDQSTWLQANRIMRRSTGLEAVPVQYSLQNVVIDGANLVNRGQQRFFVDEPQKQWPITLIFFPAQFTARDALFGWPLGIGINLTYPNGEMAFYAFDAQGAVHLPTLPRGAYQVQVANAPGLAPLTPVAISRGQEVELLVISYLDIGLFLTVGIVVAIALLLVGRPTLFYAITLRRRRPVYPLPAYYTLLSTSDEQAARAHLYYEHGYKVWAVKKDDLHLLQSDQAHASYTLLPTSDEQAAVAYLCYDNGYKVWAMKKADLHLLHKSENALPLDHPLESDPNEEQTRAMPSQHPERASAKRVYSSA